jgi:hypothetical protein
MDKPTTLTVTKQFKLQSGEAESDPTNETIEVTKFETEPAKVRVGFGLTINLGNYESARLDVSVEVPCYKEQVDDAYDKAKVWVEERVQQEVAEIKGGGSKGKGLF